MFLLRVGGRRRGHSIDYQRETVRVNDGGSFDGSVRRRVHTL